MLQAQVRQAFKDLKTIQDSLGEQIFNLEEKINQRISETNTNFNNFKRDNEMEMRERDEKLTEMMRDQIRVIEIMIKDHIQSSFPVFNVQIMDQV